MSHGQIHDEGTVYGFYRFLIERATRGFDHEGCKRCVCMQDAWLAQVSNDRVVGTEMKV